MSGHIVVGVDPYRHDAEPVAVGALLGRAVGASVLVAGIYPDATRGHGLGAAERDRAARDHALEGVRAILEQAGAGESDVHGVPFRATAIASTSPARGLHELAQREQPAVLVVGSTHRGAVGRIVPGSMTERVVHGAPCAVAVAPRGFADPGRSLRRVGVAYAGTPEGRLALRAGALLAAASGADLVAYTIVDPIVYPSIPPIEGSPEELRERAKHAAAALERELGEHAAKVNAEAVVLTACRVAPRTRWSRWWRRRPLSRADAGGLW